jgi:hypothetical protein
MCCGRHSKELAKTEEARIPAPEEYLQYIQEKNAKTTVCGALFKPGSMVITCKDCGMDPTWYSEVNCNTNEFKCYLYAMFYGK